MQEEVDDVQVEIDWGQNVFLGGELLHQHVGVVDDETAEDERPGPGEQQLCAVTVEKHLQRTPRGTRQWGSIKKAKWTKLLLFFKIS